MNYTKNYTKNCGAFSLSPSEGERAGERGHSLQSIPRAYQQAAQTLDEL